jgi:hypothetical protein
VLSRVGSGLATCWSPIQGVLPTVCKIQISELINSEWPQARERNQSRYNTNNHSNWLTPWSWALLEKPPVAQLLKNFPTFYGTRRFITVFTRALHWSLSWVRLIQSIPPHPVSLRSTVILFSHPRLGLPSVLFLYGFPTKILYPFCFSPCVLHALPISPSLTWSF